MVTNSNNYPKVRTKMLQMIEQGQVATSYSSKWNPNSVTDIMDSDRPNSPFTESTCWTFIENLLSDGHELQKVKMRNINKGVAYELIVDPDRTGQGIYIKLQLGSDWLTGLSFHYEVD